MSTTIEASAAEDSCTVRPNQAVAPHRLPGGHIAFLDGLRACAALYVVLHHALIQVHPNALRLPWLPGEFISLFRYGHYAVDVFIVLSGYCLMLPVVRSGELKGGAWLFFKKRARRILPPYYFALALSLLLIVAMLHAKTGTAWDSSLPVTKQGLLTHVVLLQDLFGGSAYQIDYPLWSISVEWRIYFLFPLLVLLTKRRSAALVSVLALALGYALALAAPRAHISPTSCFQYLGLFALGAWAVQISCPGTVAKNTFRRMTAAGAGAVSCLLIVGALTTEPIWHGKTLPSIYIDFFVGLGTLSLLIFLRENPESFASRFLGWKPMAFLGTFAYSIYLIHAPLLQVLYQTLFSSLPDRPLQLLAASWLIGAPLIVAASYLFFLGCERPFMSARAVKATKAILDAPVTAAPE